LRSKTTFKTVLILKIKKNLSMSQEKKIQKFKQRKFFNKLFPKLSIRWEINFTQSLNEFTTKWHKYKHKIFPSISMKKKYSI
jgi:hypothetical protein